MYSSTRRGPGSGTALLAVLQTLLLLSALVLVPASVIAQDADPSQDPAADTTTEAPAAEPTPEPKAAPPSAPEPEAAPKKRLAPPPFKALAPKTAPKTAPKKKAEPTLSERGLVLHTYPRKVKAGTGERIRVSAWLCPAGDRTPFGGKVRNDRVPGTDDDQCRKARNVDWSLKTKAGARLSSSTGHGVWITLLAPRDNRLTATISDLERKTKLLHASRQAAPGPKTPAPPSRPTTELPLPEAPDGPTRLPLPGPLTDLEQPADEPADEQPADEPADEQPADEPADEQPADEPADEQPADEPADEQPADEPADEQPADEPADEQPADEPADEQPADDGSTPEPVDVTDEGSEGLPVLPLPPMLEELTLDDEGPLSELPSLEELETEEPVEAVDRSDVAVASSTQVEPGTITVTVHGDGTGTVNGAEVTAFEAGTANVAGSCVTASGACTITDLEPGDYDIRVTSSVGALSPMAQVWLGSAFGNPSDGTVAYQMDRQGDESPDPVTVTSGSDESARLVMKRANLEFPEVCGLDIALVIDRSGSTSDFDQQYKNAAKDFVDALQGTPSRIGIWSFAANAQGQRIGFTDVADTTALDNAIDNLPNPGGGTNWDAGIGQVANAGADVVVVITDGNPTTQTSFWDSDTGSTSLSNVYDTEGGVTSANLVKANGQRIIGIGIGNLGGNPPTNLVNISGPTANDDYYTGGIGDLGDILEEIALRACAGNIIVEKYVSGVLTNGWDFTATINPPVSGGTVNGNSGSDTETTASINGTFEGRAIFEIAGGSEATGWPRSVDVVETVKAGFTLEDVVCTGANGSSDITNGASVTLDFDDIVTCEFYNEPDTATLTVRKRVRNDNGGTATVADFGIQTSPVLTLTPWSDDAGDPVTIYYSQTNVVSPGRFTLSEAELDGYTEGNWNCKVDGGDWFEVGPYDAGVIDLVADQDVICAITNDDDAASLVLAKTVVNDNGGTATASDWTLFAGGLSVTGSEAGAEVTDVAGTYALSESALAGYANTSITCDDAPDVEVTSVTIGLGETVTCTFVNDDLAAGLFLAKDVVNDNGGTATASDWTLSAGDDDVTGSATPVLATTVAGTYALSESALAGYANTSITCDDAPDVEVTSVTIGLGETVTCTFVNDDLAAGLFLAKDVVNDNGGTATASDWTLYAGDDDVTGSATPVLATTVAGTYALSESALAGYANTSITCDDAPDVEVTSVTIGLGETVTCTFVNDDDAATIVLRKTVDGGDATQADFAPSIDGQPVAWDEVIDVLPGAHSVSEVMDADDYVAGAWGGDCAADGSVSVELGDELECTITNFYAALDIVKSAEPSFYAELGDVISYTITATNIGAATLTDVSVTDEFPAGLDDFECTPVAPATLAPGESIVCTATHTITAADIDAGEVFNQACAAADEVSERVCDDETVRLSELEIVKTADVDAYAEVGDVIGYTIIATNTGETALTDVDISDNLMADLVDWECTPPLVVAELQPGERIVCTASYVIEQDDIVAGEVFNQACADSDQTPEVCDDVTTPYAELEIEKSATPDTYSAAGDEIVYTVTATNTGVAPLENVDISDALIDGLESWTCRLGDTETTLPVAELLSGQSITCSATYVITADDVTGSEPEGSVVNTACADSDQTPEVCDEVTVNEIVIELVKSVTPAVLAEPGGIFTYTLYIDNESVVPLEITELTDDNSALSPDWAAECAALVGRTLAPDAPGTADEVSCTYTVERTVAGTYPNTAQVAATDANGREATAQDDESVRVLRSEIDIVKQASVEYYTGAGEAIVYTVTATNIGESTLTDVDISDELIDGLESWTCDPDDPVASLAPGDSIVCTATYTTSAADVEAGSVFNQACVVSDQTTEVCDDVDIPYAELTIVKQASVEYYTGAGEAIVYTVTATNTGVLTLTDVDISDALIDGLDSWTCDPDDPVASLAPGDSIVCSATYTTSAADVEAGSVFNQACVDSDQTPEVCDEVDIPYAELTIVKTSDYISYSAVGDEVDYTVIATNTGNIALSDVDISDALIDGLESWTCDPDDPVASLAPGDSIVCTATYVITQADIDAGSVFNQACVDSDETPEVCDEVTVFEIAVVLDKTPSSKLVGQSGDEVTFTLTYSHPVTANPIYAYALVDDIYGDLFDAANPSVTDNTCADGYGELLAPDTEYSCRFTGAVFPTVGDPHVNVATITVTDADPIEPPQGYEPRFATASDDAVVRVPKPSVAPTEVPSVKPTEEPSKKPTDLLLATDTGPADSGDVSGSGGYLSWAVWVLLSALLIVGSGWVIRRQRLAEVRQR